VAGGRLNRSPVTHHGAPVASGLVPDGSALLTAEYAEIAENSRSNESPTTKDTTDTKKNRHELSGWEDLDPFVFFVPTFLSLAV